MSQHRIQTYYIYFIYLIMFIVLTMSVLARFRILSDTLCSLSALILPFVYLCTFFFISMIYFLSAYRDVFFKTLALFVLIPILLWPPLWLVRAQMPQKRVPDQTIRVTTWNVARMGELAQNHKKETKQERLHCVHKTLMNVHTDIFALQEISKSRVAALEESMNLKCKHIDYYGTGRGHLGGLAICTHREGTLKINFARNFQLPGRWRALFAEIESSASLDKKRFNLLNVHFLPHKISPRKIKNAMEDLAQGSIHSSLELIKRMIHTTRMQGTQAEALMQIIHTFIDPTMIVGDFNSPAHSKVHWVLGQEWTDTWKAAGRDFGATRYFAGWLPFRVDFIYAHRHTFHTLSSFVEPSKCSDHYPLSTDVLLQEVE